ncbi:hypothetical protein W97_06537 [Coniosporium apollinis CBS 100218]|uniref:C2H2-type domain-containing protein n=1 Tax=Coniosporium apollinis (strain CBS 100218) TaxID=1168221 RepID=R7YZR3_CONA1|nr:uncharacterized protein W97_06537 [Coniosporium apollinis CBS 100218]EON67284.1 hypothetical protein W97_06537 [Coniosporium apollinis CBS 100218]
MGKKKRGHPDVEEVLARPWCYYCERDFDDLKILISHQKAKHFKCERCGRRLNTAGGLSVHMNQVHKENLTNVENALPNRAGLDIEIFGMEGIPEDVIQSHNQRVLQQYYEAEAERRAATGNPGPGGTAAAGGAKKPKFESPSDLKKRLAEHKAKKAAQEAAGGSSGDVTPLGAGHGAQSPAINHSPLGFAGPPGYMQQQPAFSGPQGTPPQSAYTQPYGQPPQYAQAPIQSPYQQHPPFSQPGFGGPPPFSPAGASPFSPPPGQQYPQPGVPSFPPQFPGGPPRPFGAGSPPFHQGPSQPPHNHNPSAGPIPSRQGSLPAAPGLPQRPSFGAPHVNAFQLQQMHQGHIPGATNPSQTGGFPPQQSHAPPNEVSEESTGGTREQDHSREGAPGSAQYDTPQPAPANATSVDELISSAAKDVDGSKPATTEAGPEKKAKKEKDKNTRQVYTDNDVSPEEKMAQLPRYAFVPDYREETVLGPAEAAVTGPALGEDDVIDRMD